MAREIKDRYSSAAEFADDLERWLHRRPLEWRRPSAPRRFFLWAHRHPGRATGSIAGFLILFGVTGGWWYTSLRDAEREAAAQREGLRLAQIEIKHFKDRGAASLRPLILALAGAKGPNAIDEGALAILVWIQWISEHPVLGTDGTIPSAMEEGRILERIIMVGERAGTPDQLDVLLARFALTISLLKVGALDVAAPHLSALERSPLARLDPADPVSVSLRACRVAADALAARQAGTDLATAREALERCEVEITGNGRCRPALRLVQGVQKLVGAGREAASGRGK